ncbi:MAG: DUF6088 family protein [Nitrospira sp.]|nr:DUF6088 family protein [Nitrospira sp.]
MKVSHPIARKLLARLESSAGAVVSVKDLTELGSRAAVDQALSRLVREGRILRVRRGLYAWPRTSALLKRSAVPSPDELAQAWAKKNGLRLVPSGAYAANLLGLTTQVPARITYYTNGRTKTLTLGPYSVRLLNRGPKTMDVAGRVSALVLQALRYVGKAGVTPEKIARLRSVLHKRDRADLARALAHAPAWMKPVLHQIIVKEAR